MFDFLILHLQLFWALLDVLSDFCGYVKTEPQRISSEIWPEGVNTSYFGPFLPLRKRKILLKAIVTHFTMFLNLGWSRLWLLLIFWGPRARVRTSYCADLVSTS